MTNTYSKCTGNNYEDIIVRYLKLSCMRSHFHIYRMDRTKIINVFITLITVLLLDNSRF